MEQRGYARLGGSASKNNSDFINESGDRSQEAKQCEAPLISKCCGGGIREVINRLNVWGSQVQCVEAWYSVW